jgi:predicted ATPase
VPHIAITGAPGSGKTTLLAELSKLGYATVPESARAVIAERLARGQPPRPDPLSFAQEIFRRDAEKFERTPQGARHVFFDRGAVEAIGMLAEASTIESAELARLLESYRFHRQVFILPPWNAIYTQDAERDHTFEHALAVHAALTRWYSRCGYELVEVPCAPVAERARHVLRALADLDDRNEEPGRRDD